MLAFLLVFCLFIRRGSGVGTEVFGEEGGSVDLTCDPVYDDHEILFWEVIQGTTGFTIVLVKEPGKETEIHEKRYAKRLLLQNGNNLRISNLNRDDDSVDSTDPHFVGTYRCSQGTAGTQWILRVRRGPSPPTNLAVTAVRLYSVEVEVTGGHNGLEPQSLCVWYREHGMGEWKKGKGENSCKNGVDKGQEITLRSTLPTANTPYQICVVSQNRLNSSRCEEPYIQQATTDSLASFNATIRLPSEPYKSPDPNNRENQELVSRIVNSINTALKPTHPDLEVEVIQFREGSVLADLKMSVGQREVQHVKDDFVSDVRSERLTGIDVDKNFILIENEIPPVQDDTSPQETDLLAKVLLPIASLAVIAVIAGVAAYLLYQRSTYFEGAADTMEVAIAMALQALRELTKDDANLSILLPTPPATEKPISNVRAPDTGFHKSADCKSIVAKVEKASSLVVSGPTGSGKTQGILAYAQEFAKKNEDSVMWFFGRSENEEKGLTKETVLEQGRDLANKLGEGNLTPEELPNKIMESLQSRQGKSLLIFDDVTATSGVSAAYLATNEKVAVFIVTRSSNLDLNLPEHKMEGFPDEDVLYFFKRQDERSLEIFKETSDEDLLKLGKHFGNLPHGLTLARSYLLSSRTSVKGYLRQLEERSSGVSGELKEHEKAVYGAILTSMEDRMSRSSQDMLKFTAVLSQDRIPVFILSKALEIASGEEPDKDEFIREVGELSLARVEGRQEEWIDGRMISVHQQTQAAILCSLDEQERDTMTKSLVQTFLEYFHKDTRKIQDGYINGLLLPHVEAVLKLPTISKLPEEYFPGLARLYETVGYMYCQKRLPEVAAPSLDKAKEMIGALVPLDTGTDNIFQLLVSKGEELYNKEDVYSRSLKKRVLTTGDVKVLKTKVPALSDEFSKAAQMGKPLTEDQYQQLEELHLAYNSEQMRKSFLVELAATVLYASARRIFYFQGEERVQYRPTAEHDLNLSLALSRKLAEDQGLQILNKMLCRRVGTLYLLKETDGKSPEQQKSDFLQAIAGYQELINDGNDYFENSVLKKIGDDDFHRMFCYRAIVDTYLRLICLAATDKERADFICLLDENAKKMVEFGEKQVKKDERGNVVEGPEMLPEIYNMAGNFLVEMLEDGFMTNQGTITEEDGSPLERARQWYRKALEVKSIKPHHEAVSCLGLAKVYTLIYEAEKSKAAQNVTSATKGDTRIPIDGTEEKITLVEKQPTLDVIHHLTNAKGDMNKCLEIYEYEEKLRNRMKDIQEAKKWNDRIVRHIDSLLTETKEQETNVV